jgi:hypothetical protein
MTPLFTMRSAADAWTRRLLKPVLPVSLVVNSLPMGARLLKPLFPVPMGMNLLLWPNFIMIYIFSCHFYPLRCINVSWLLDSHQSCTFCSFPKPNAWTKFHAHQHIAFLNPVEHDDVFKKYTATYADKRKWARRSTPIFPPNVQQPYPMTCVTCHPLSSAISRINYTVLLMPFIAHPFFVTFFPQHRYSVHRTVEHSRLFCRELWPGSFE